MKELSIEEKAVAYDKVREKIALRFGSNVAEEIFSVFEKSEDEKIRKELIHYLQDAALYKAPMYKGAVYSAEEAVVWLEKQAEQKLNPILDIDIPFGAKDSELQEASYHIPKGFHAKIEGNRVVIKRGEQKPAEWTEEDETTKNNINHIIRQYDKISKKENQPCWYVGDCLLWMQNIKERVQPQPRQEWREEDYNFIKELCDLLASISKDGYVGKYYTVDLVEKLKSLKPQKTWKPSDEQMDVIEAVVNNRSFQRRHLDSLYEQLKKLREG